MLDKPYFVKVMTGLCELFNKTPSEFIFDIYYEAFKEYSDEQINTAVTNCVKTYKYNTLPKPADIIEWIEGTKDDKALNAWLTARSAIARVGYYNSVAFGDPIISRVISEMGGWVDFCSQLTCDMPFVEKRFREIYKTFEKKDIHEPVPLVGFLESQNRLKGLTESIPKAVRIGFD